MSVIRKIINATLSKNIAETDFDGKVYFSNDKIDPLTYNKLLEEYKPHLGNNLQTVFDSKILLSLLLDVEDNTLDETYYLHKSTLFFDIGFLHLVSLYEDDTEVDVDFKLIYWDDIEFVQRTGTDENVRFKFYFKDNTDFTEISIDDLNIKELKSVEILLNLFNSIIEYKNNPIDDSIVEHSGLKEEILNFFKNGNYEKALEELENFKKICDVDDIYSENSSFYYIGKTKSLIELNQLENALETIDIYIKKDVDQIDPQAYGIKGYVLYKTNKFVPAVNFLAISEENYNEEDDKKEVKDLKEKSYSKLKEVFLDVPYNERKLIFIGEDIYSTKFNDIIVLKKNNIPANVNFPIGHPHVHQVYTCHPHKQNFYFPLKNYSGELFKDRINEFCYLLQCLGATKLEISSNKSNLSDQKVNSKREVDANGEYKFIKAEFNYKNDKDENTSVDMELRIAQKQEFKPIKAPFIPSDLVWYHSDLNWQRLVAQRLNGNIMNHSELISSSQSEIISSHELMQVDVELKLLFLKIGVKYSSEKEMNMTSIKKHDWLVTVEFEDIDKLSVYDDKLELNSPRNTDSINEEYNLNLEKYKEDVLFMLENDGVIDELERNLLNRKIKKYGITKKDAKSIEKELMKLDYSENELLYIEELKEMLEEGEIGDIERKLLERYAQKFKLNKEIQKKIDTIFII